MKELIEQYYKRLVSGDSQNVVLKEFADDIVSYCIGLLPEETPDEVDTIDGKKFGWWEENRGSDSQLYNTGFDEAITEMKYTLYRNKVNGCKHEIVEWGSHKERADRIRADLGTCSLCGKRVIKQYKMGNVDGIIISNGK